MYWIYMAMAIIGFIGVVAFVGWYFYQSFTIIDQSVRCVRTRWGKMVRNDSANSGLLDPGYCFIWLWIDDVIPFTRKELEIKKDVKAFTKKTPDPDSPEQYEPIQVTLKLSIRFRWGDTFDQLLRSYELLGDPGNFSKVTDILEEPFTALARTVASNLDLRSLESRIGFDNTIRYLIYQDQSVYPNIPPQIIEMLENDQLEPVGANNVILDSRIDQIQYHLEDTEPPEDVKKAIDEREMAKLNKDITITDAEAEAAQLRIVAEGKRDALTIEGEGKAAYLTKVKAAIGAKLKHRDGVQVLALLQEEAVAEKTDSYTRIAGGNAVPMVQIPSSRGD